MDYLLTYLLSPTYLLDSTISHIISNMKIYAIFWRRYLWTYSWVSLSQSRGTLFEHELFRDSKRHTVDKTQKRGRKRVEERIAFSVSLFSLPQRQMSSRNGADTRRQFQHSQSECNEVTFRPIQAKATRFRDFRTIDHGRPTTTYSPKHENLYRTETKSGKIRYAHHVNETNAHEHSLSPTPPPYLRRNCPSRGLLMDIELWSPTMSMSSIKKMANSYSPSNISWRS